MLCVSFLRHPLSNLYVFDEYIKFLARHRYFDLIALEESLPSGNNQVNRFFV